MNSTDRKEIRRILYALDAYVRRNEFRELGQFLGELGNDMREACVVSLAQIYGVHVPGLDRDVPAIPHRSMRQGEVRFRELEIVSSGRTRRVTASNNNVKAIIEVCSEGLRVCDTDIVVGATVRVPEIPGRLYGVYAPDFGLRNVPHHVRFNPRNRGSCIGACVFCQRAYQIPTVAERDSRRDWLSTELVDQLEERYGYIIPTLRHALVVTELYGNADEYLTICEQIKQDMAIRGFRGQFSAVAQEIRSERQIRRHFNLVDGFDFCYTLECFDRRSQLMGKYKAIELDQIRGILSIAMETGFRYTMVNYIAGLDKLEGFMHGLDSMSEVLNAIGINIYVPYSDGHERIGSPDRLRLTYYWDILCAIIDRGMKVYGPELYERSPELVALLPDSCAWVIRD